MRFCHVLLTTVPQSLKSLTGTKRGSNLLLSPGTGLKLTLCVCSEIFRHIPEWKFSMVPDKLLMGVDTSKTFLPGTLSMCVCLNFLAKKKDSSNSWNQQKDLQRLIRMGTSWLCSLQRMIGSKLLTYFYSFKIRSALKDGKGTRGLVPSFSVARGGEPPLTNPVSLGESFNFLPSTWKVHCLNILKLIEKGHSHTENTLGQNTHRNQCHCH